MDYIIAKYKFIQFIHLILVIAFIAISHYILSLVAGEDYLNRIWNFIIIFAIIFVIQIGYIIYILLIGSYLSVYRITEAPSNIKRMVNEVAAKMNVAPPTTYIVLDSSPNAFVTYYKGKQTLFINQGLLNIMNEDEIKSVIGHELAHIINNDVITTVIFTAIAATAINLLDIAIEFFKRQSRRNQAIIVIVGIILSILLIIISTLLKYSLFRLKEYLADYMSAKYTNKNSMISALRKLDNFYKQHQIYADPVLSNFYIVTSRLENNSIMNIINNLLSTHPPIDKRIEAIQRSF
jgi:heat shock protein HtpX